MAGRNPYVSQYLYEGNFIFLRETSILHLSHPLLILLSGLLSLTPWQYFVVDIIISGYFIAAACFTTLLYVRLREKYKIPISNELIIIISLSATFSVWSLILGSSAGMYIWNQATLALIFIGLIHSDWKYGIAWVGCAVANAFLASHGGELVFTLFFATLFVIAYSLVERSFRPIIIWVGGGILTGFLILPFLSPVLSGLLESRRAGALDIEQVVTLNFPFPSSLLSYFIGTFCAFLGQQYYQNCAVNPLQLLAFPSCFGAWLIFKCRMPWKNIQPVAWCFIGFAAFALLVVDRPIWLQEYFFQHIPLIRSLRWPYKEFMFFIFFMHLWMIMVPPRGTTSQIGLLLAVGLGFWLFPLIAGGAPSQSLRKEDRAAITSGASDRYWLELKKKLPEDVLIIPALGPNIGHGFWSLPQSALGTYLYGALFRVKTPFYYSPTRVMYVRVEGGTFNGFGLLLAPPFLPDDVKDFPDWMKRDKKIRVLRAVNAIPFRVELLNPSEGIAEDITPIWEKALRDSHAFAP